MVDFLERANGCARDARLTFDEPSHTYTWDGRKLRTSTTGWIGSFFPKFDPDGAIAAMKRSTRKPWPRPEYAHEDGTAFTDQEIKDAWEENRDGASERGTRGHRWVEVAVNMDAKAGGDLAFDASCSDVREDIVPFAKTWLTAWLPLYRSRRAVIQHYRTEWMVYADDIELPGSIDWVGVETASLAGGAKPRVHLVDWKCSDKVDMKAHAFNRARAPLAHLGDTRYMKYALQLNVYARILERFYGVQVVSMTVVSLHPAAPQYVMDVPRMEAEMDAMWRHRLSALGKEVPFRASKADGESGAGESKADGESKASAGVVGTSVRDKERREAAAQERKAHDKALEEHVDLTAATTVPAMRAAIELWLSPDLLPVIQPQLPLISARCMRNLRATRHLVPLPFASVFAPLLTAVKQANSARVATGRPVTYAAT